MNANTNYELTETDRAMLELERHWWKYPGAKDQTIRDTFPGLTVTRYYQQLNVLIDRTEAEAAYPMVVKRLRRIRARRLVRSARPATN